MEAFDNLLVVCVGNICRSPMAAAILTEYYPKKYIDSAGLSALVDQGADPKAVSLMATYQIDIGAHVAKQINTALVSQADLIFTMSTGQTKWLESRWPHCRGKTFRVGHWLDKDVIDPYQQDDRAFEKSRQDIADGLKQWHKKMQEVTAIKALRMSECY